MAKTIYKPKVNETEIIVVGKNKEKKRENIFTRLLPFRIGQKPEKTDNGKIVIKHR